MCYSSSSTVVLRRTIELTGSKFSTISTSTIHLNRLEFTEVFIVGVRVKEAIPRLLRALREILGVVSVFVMATFGPDYLYKNTNIINSAFLHNSIREEHS